MTTCQACHRPGEAQAQPTAVPGAEAAPQATVAPVVEASAIPHAIEGPENQCLACHATGSIEPFPPAHEGFTNQMCLGCHAPED